MTPMMEQYFEVKNKYKDHLLFYRLGDFYEMFFDDAVTASRELELTLTGRDCGEAERAPMCGVPFHSAEGYIGKLISKGYKVAICEQVEDPAQAKAAVAWMSEMSLLDDYSTAQQIVARCISKGYGRARAKQALFEKRIPKEYWEDALKDYPEQLDKIMDFLESHLGEDATPKDVKRVMDALIRRGHSYGTIRRAMQEMAMDSHDLPEV